MTAPGAKTRLDVALVERGLAPTRERAQALVLAGLVDVDGQKVDKAGTKIAAGSDIRVRGNNNPFVSRGGLKLRHALDAFAIDVAARIAMDVGASTGGFTDVLLQRGAAHVVAIDAGRGQLDWKLRTDERVTVMERTNVRTLGEGAIGDPAAVCVADLSFISLRTVAPHLVALTTADAEFVLLVKPQYEAGRARVGMGGIVRDPQVHAAVVGEVVAGLETEGIGVVAVVESPITGADGNVEFFAHARRGPATVELPA